MNKNLDFKQNINKYVYCTKRNVCSIIHGRDTSQPHHTC